MPTPMRCLCALLLFAAAGCAAGRSSPKAPGPVGSDTKAPGPSRDAAASAVRQASSGESAESILTEVLERKPLVIGVGEGHAQKGTEAIASATRRFTESLLPLLAGRASDIVIELWMPDPKCEKKVEEVRRQQEPVVREQAKTNKSEMVILAEEAKKIGIVPWPLRPTCEEYDAVSAAGDQAVAMMLDLTAKMASRTIEACLRRNAKNGIDKIVVSYGGAMHNDLVPAEGREAWTFAPRISALTNGRYVELDLFVPESIRDTPSWQRLAWFLHFDRTRAHAESTVFQPGENSYVVIFPSTAR
jgi:hypothetical protein